MRTKDRFIGVLLVGVFLLLVIFKFSTFNALSRNLHQLNMFYIPAYILKLKVNAIEIEKQEKTALIASAIGSRNPTDLVQPFEDTILIHPNTRSLSLPFAVVLVTSLPKDGIRRELIRETWYKWAKDLNIIVYFYLGLPENKNLTDIASEAALHGDIILDNFQEDYYKLTIKVLRMLKWFVSIYQENLPQYFVKADHDVFVNLPALVNYLKNVNDSLYIGGFLPFTLEIIRDPSSKWYTPESLYSSKAFPKFAAGSCYVMSGSVVEKLYLASFNVPIIHLEDVYLLGLVASNHLQMNISNIDRMVNLEDLAPAVRASKVLQTTVSLHRVEPPNLMLEIYERTMNGQGLVSRGHVCFNLAIVCLLLIFY